MKGSTDKKELNGQSPNDRDNASWPKRRSSLMRAPDANTRCFSTALLTRWLYVTGIGFPFS